MKLLVEKILFICTEHNFRSGYEHLADKAIETLNEYSLLQKRELVDLLSITKDSSISFDDKYITLESTDFRLKEHQLIIFIHIG